MASRIPGQATVRDVAAATGVSIATVSRVLNGRAHVADETRRRVQEAGDRLGGTTAAATRPVTYPVYVRCPYPLTDYFGPIVSSVGETLRLHGREMLLDTGGASYHDDVLRRLPSRGEIAGAVLILPPEQTSAIEALRASGTPFVVIDPRVRVPRDVLSVSAANFSGSRDATAHLTGLGHRRIGVISAGPVIAAGEARLAGHASALAQVASILMLLDF